jgi:hypothetical protein
MAPTSALQRPTGCQPAASKIAQGAILLGACTHVECAYKDWQWVVEELWEHECHRLQRAACRCLLDKRAAHECQEAARQEAACTAQRLLYKRATHECQEAARRQWLLDKETARPQRLLNEEAARCLMAKRTALARRMAAAQTILLWLCRCRLHVWLARQTLRQQQHEAALARLR